MQNEKFLSNVSNIFNDNFIYFDGILSKYSSVKKIKTYTVYTAVNVGSIKTVFIAKKDEYTAHGENVKKAIIDLEFKIITEKIKKDPILETTEFSFKKYRILTGSCYSGMRDFADLNNIKYKETGDKEHPIQELKPILAKDLLPILEKNNAYGVEKFKKLINW